MNASLRLVVIADDLTGSFDTGVQFEKRGASVSFTTLCKLDCFAAETDVVVIDAESRHITPQEAFEKTSLAARWAKSHGAAHLYIKTDSGLRGSVGPAIMAALEVTGCPVAAFAPAYPDMKRTTVNGCQLIDGVPVHKSVFGRDPFDPVTAPTVRELIEPFGVSVQELKPDGVWPASTEKPTVWVIDAETNGDLAHIARRLSERNALHVTAGCAGFAAALYDSFGLPNAPTPIAPFTAPLLVVCGSVNPITRKQMLFGESLGYERRVIDPLLLTSDAWRASLESISQDDQNLLIDTGLTGSEAFTPLRETIAGRLGWLMRHLLLQRNGRPCTPMIIGGDTLMGFLSLLEKPDVRLEGEALPGVVIFSVLLNGRRVRLLSKSGGFGDETLLKELCDLSQQRRI